MSSTNTKILGASNPESVTTGQNHPTPLLKRGSDEEEEISESKDDQSHTLPTPHHAPPNRSLYEWTARIECKKLPQTISSTNTKILEASNPESVTTGQNHPTPLLKHDQSPSPTPHHAPPNRNLYEWTARIECKTFELLTSYSVLIFLGHVPDDPEEWQVSPNYVGSHFAFVNSAGRENHRDIVIEGFVHLNQAIIRHSGLKSLEPDGVIPYLTTNLHWRVLKVNCEPAKLNSLEVTVHATPLSFPPGAIFPVPGESHRYDCITYGQEGGSRHAPTVS